MATAESPRGSAENADQLLTQWKDLLSALVRDVRRWADDLGWSTRELPKPMEDSVVGDYTVNGLLLQKEYTKLLLEPVGRSTERTDGIVDLYLMPGLDDVARLYHDERGWQLLDLSPKSPTVATADEAESHPFTKEVFQKVIDKMCNRAI